MINIFLVSLNLYFPSKSIKQKWHLSTHHLFKTIAILNASSYTLQSSRKAKQSKKLPPHTASNTNDK